MLSSQRKDVLPPWHGPSTFITSHCLQDLGECSKNLIMVMWDDKDAECEEDRKLGTKQNKKRQ